MMLFIGLILLAVIFALYAIGTKYSATSPDQTMPKRIMVALGLAAATAGAALAHGAQAFWQALFQ